MTEYINLTPHTIAIVSEDGNITHVFRPSGLVARVREIADEMPYYDGIPTYRLQYGEITGIPVSNGPTFIVSHAVLEAANRQDIYHNLVVPYPLVPDHTGPVIGCRGFAKLYSPPNPT